MLASLSFRQRERRRELFDFGHLHPQRRLRRSTARRCLRRR
jgi:hypothetical protein